MKKTDFNVSEDTSQKFIEKREYLEIEDKGATDAEKMAAAKTTAAEKAAAAAAVNDIDFEEPKKKRWGGWWAAALFALLAIGCCIYLGTRVDKETKSKTAQSLTGNALSSSGKSMAATGKSIAATGIDALSDAGDKVADAASKAADKTADAFRSVTGKVKGAADYALNSVTNSVASANPVQSGGSEGVSVYGRYPVATESQVDRAADQDRTIDYLYYFKNGQSEIADNEVLNTIAEKASETGAEITITAYASPTGSAAFNANLCNERARNLEEYLEAHGVESDHIKIINGGQTDQFGGDAYNRRADILVNYAG